MGIGILKTKPILTVDTQAHWGFTLIELLIVIVIISIVASVAVVNIHINHHKYYETFANQLVNTFQLAEQEAMLRPATLGFALSDHTFAFYLYQFDKKNKKFIWQSFPSPLLGTHPIAHNMELTLRINHQQIAPNQAPQLVISPSGDITPFVIYIGKKAEAPFYKIIGKANGEVSSAAIIQK